MKWWLLLEKRKNSEKNIFPQTMQYFLTENISSNSSNKQIFLDNDFLSFLFENDDVLEAIPRIFSNSSLVIDSFSEFEFLRDIFVPSERVLREQFISYNIFIPALNHQKIYLKIQANALLLSKLYAHHYPKCKPSSIDLFLAGRIMYNRDNSYLITGNKKDFPTFIFDTIGVISAEKDQSNGMRSFCLMKFNQSKFDHAYTEYLKMESKGIEELKNTLP